MVDSILDSVKKNLGMPPEVTEFDADIILHINATFSTLNQLGIGPVSGFAIEDNTATWDSFLLNDDRFNDVKQYIYMKVRVAFDPPDRSFVLASWEKMITELEWRINVRREGDANGIELPADEVIWDGGAP